MTRLARVRIQSCHCYAWLRDAEVLVKGGDWPVEKIVGARETLARGGRVVSVPFEHQRSSTALLEKIRKA